MTDGKNESEGPEGFEEALGEAMGVFECDCRGVGTNWIVSELRTVATTLLGARGTGSRNPENLEQAVRHVGAVVAQAGGCSGLTDLDAKGAQLLDQTQLQQEEEHCRDPEPGSRSTT